MTGGPAARSVDAVLFDFGGVVSSSPFEAFERFERERGLPAGFLRQVNATDPDSNAWARLERAELGPQEFDEAFAAESSALGHEVRGADVLALLAGDLRPEVVGAIRRLRQAGFPLALLTNNHVPFSQLAVPADGPRHDDVLALFDAVVESSVVGVRKPEPEFYELACRTLGVAPDRCAFLDDLGVNLKPARAMGMATIKVADPAAALAELEHLVAIPLR